VCCKLIININLIYLKQLLFYNNNCTHRYGYQHRNNQNNDSQHSCTQNNDNQQNDARKNATMPQCHKMTLGNETRENNTRYNSKFYKIDVMLIFKIWPLCRVSLCWMSWRLLVFSSSYIFIRIMRAKQTFWKTVRNCVCYLTAKYTARSVQDN
jgi:hypothetical protein